MIREITVRALRTPLEAAGVALDCKGYVSSFADNLLPSVLPDDFKAELEGGRGDEMHGKFRAAHSSSALAVNCFGPFKRHLADLRLPGLTSVSCMVFEKPCPTGLRGTPPHLDVFLEGATVLAIESKCTEHLSSKVARFSSTYATLHDYRLSPW
ncbi:MAG: hypothetical protein OXG51_03925, partial [Gammaproteobacteria bacterium]|nr:hypothetical protein [Gammaproteobacteria bacterium]